MRLNENEENDLRQELATMRKKGEEHLKVYQSAGGDNFYAKKYKDWKECPICS